MKQTNPAFKYQFLIPTGKDIKIEWPRNTKLLDMKNILTYHNNNTIENCRRNAANAEKQVTASVFSTLLRCFGPAFVFGSLLKLVQDLLTFVSPQVLKYVDILLKFEEYLESALHLRQQFDNNDLQMAYLICGK